MCEIARRHPEQDGPWVDHLATAACVAHSVADSLGAICSICLFHVWCANPIRTAADGSPTTASICLPCEEWLHARRLFRRDVIDSLVEQSYTYARRAHRAEILRTLKVTGPVM